MTLTPSFQHLTGSYGAIGKCEGDDLVVSRIFDLCDVLASARWSGKYPDALTFSRMTSGPLTPPTVLYLILGVTE